MVSYAVMLRTFLADIDNYERFKRDTIIKFAEQLEREQYPIDQINHRIVEDVEPRISRQYVGQVLKDTKYKDTSKIHKKKKKELIQIAADGSVIESDEARLEREEAEGNVLEHEQFTRHLDKLAEQGSKEIQSLDKAVLQELDQSKDRNKELEKQLKDVMAINEDQKEFLDDVSEYFGSWIRVSQDYKIVDVADTKEDTKVTKAIRIDLKMFESDIKDSFKSGKESALIRHDGKNAISWN